MEAAKDTVLLCGKEERKGEGLTSIRSEIFVGQVKNLSYGPWRKSLQRAAQARPKK